MNFNIGKTFKRIFSFHRKERDKQIELSEKVKADTKKPVLTGSGNKKWSHNSPWWTRIYNVKERNQVGSLHKHCLSHFGNFSPVNGIVKKGKGIEVRSSGRYSKPFRPLGIPYGKEYTLSSAPQSD